MAPRRHLNAPTIAALLAAAGTVAACGGERTAEAETDTSEVEVSTTLPEGALSDEQLQRQAEDAAQAASDSPPATMVVPAQPGVAPPPAVPAENAGTKAPG